MFRMDGNLAWVKIKRRDKKHKRNQDMEVPRYGSTVIVKKKMINYFSVSQLLQLLCRKYIRLKRLNLWATRAINNGWISRSFLWDVTYLMIIILPSQEMAIWVASFLVTMHPPFWKAVISLLFGKEHFIEAFERSMVVVGYESCSIWKLVK